jgi:hypothetical protein
MGDCLRLRVPVEIRHPVRRSRWPDRLDPYAVGADRLARLLRYPPGRPSSSPLPNLWWNATHDATTIKHTTSIAHWSALSLDIRHGVEFFAAQFGVVGPIVFFAMLWAVYRCHQGTEQRIRKLLIWLSVPVVLLITLQALMAKAYANWAVTAYVAGTILAVWLLHREWPKGLRVSLADQRFRQPAVSAGGRLRPSAGAAEWRRGDEALSRAQRHQPRGRRSGAPGRYVTIIVSDSRDMLADMFHTLRNEPLRIYARPPAERPDSY